jgi:glutamate dehydrogenase/leucine dehydrogenase
VRDYDTVSSFFLDGLRLSQGMTLKCALSGIWHGGGKALIIENSVDTIHDRPAMFAQFGRFVSSLRGCYITAPDVGASVLDMVTVHSQTRFVTCLPPNLGGSGSPAIPTV